MSDTKKNPTTFDKSTAESFASNVADSPHHAYRDADGAICLVCMSATVRGGVFVNEGALKWLREQQGAKYVRVINPASELDITGPLLQFPNKTFRDGPFGRYCIVDANDFGNGPDYPPAADYAKVL